MTLSEFKIPQIPFAFEFELWYLARIKWKQKITVSTWREQFLAIFGSSSAFSSIDHNAKNWMKRRKRNQNMPSPSMITELTNRII